MENINDKNKYNEQQYKFNDGVRTVDFVLVYAETNRKMRIFKIMQSKAEEERKIFETNLKEEGLELEEDFVEGTGLHFIKIHAPMKILKRYAEILKLRMPIRNIFSSKTVRDQNNESEMSVNRIKNLCHPITKWFELAPNIFPDYSEEYTTVYTRAKDYLFDPDSPTFLAPAQKSRIVQFILDRTLYTRMEEEHADVFDFGISRLVMHGTYVAAYPLHDGDWNTEGTMRYKLYKYWASFNNCFKLQPDDVIMQYYGVKIALYFIWLGHYVRMLIPASIVGLTCFLISVILFHQSDTVREVCDGKIPGVMCPLCDYNCPFWKVEDFCFEAKILYIFDNFTTVFFAVFISFWAAIFLECWKRCSAEITLRWDLTAIDDMDENPRPEYAAKLSQMAAAGKIKQELNIITNVYEPKITYWRHIFPRKMYSIFTSLCLVSLALLGVVAVIVFETFVLTNIPNLNWIVSNMMSTLLNLACILILSVIYEKISMYMTEQEMHRTQPEFDNSLILKLYLMEFVNNYAYIFYIAFFKGKTTGSPSKYHRVFGHRKLECSGGSCMLELTEQLAIIMVGKRIITSLTKIIWPVIQVKWRKMFMIPLHRDETKVAQWEKDFLLEEEGTLTLFLDTLDMVIQYGFVTIFVSVFPLAPLFAFLNNILEIRIDAQKLLLYRRRPQMRRTKDMGVWLNVLDTISWMAIFTNGYIIAFTSNFIPRMVYRVLVTHDFEAHHFLNFTLSYVAIEDLDMKGKPNTTEKYCRYLGFREPPWEEDKYDYTDMFWYILTARLMFFIMFENLIVLLVMLVKWLIPDIPQSVKTSLRRRHFLINEIIISYETTQKSWWSKNFAKIKTTVVGEKTEEERVKIE